MQRGRDGGREEGGMEGRREGKENRERKIWRVQGERGEGEEGVQGYWNGERMRVRRGKEVVR